MILVITDAISCLIGGKSWEKKGKLSLPSNACIESPTEITKVVLLRPYIRNYQAFRFTLVQTTVP